MFAKPTNSAFDVEGYRVVVTRKRIKNLHMRLGAAGKELAVSAPLRFSDAQVAAFVREHLDWVQKQMMAREQSPAAAAAEASPQQVKAWRAWVEERTPALVEQWSARMGVECKKLAYRNMSSRWGSCIPETGRICINVRLALYPPECLEYVVVHELAHLRERGHGPAFKAVMDEFLPDWRKRRAKLR